MKVEFRYRDASNYKTYFEHEIDIIEHPDAIDLKVDDQITMGEYGTLEDFQFFGSEVHPHEYDEEFDHDILEVLGVNKA